MPGIPTASPDMARIRAMIIAPVCLLPVPPRSAGLDPNHASGHLHKLPKQFQTNPQGPPNATQGPYRNTKNIQNVVPGIHRASPNIARTRAMLIALIRLPPGLLQSACVDPNPSATSYMDPKKLTRGHSGLFTLAEDTAYTPEPPKRDGHESPKRGPTRQRSGQ
jgi:hypothetical protein